jgi:hypothetical protein
MALYCKRWILTRVVGFASEIFPDDPDKGPNRGPFSYCLGTHGVPCDMTIMTKFTLGRDEITFNAPTANARKVDISAQMPR